MTELGPVSAVLEAELRTKTRRHGIVVWLDPDAHYSSLVDRLITQRRDKLLPYPVQAYIAAASSNCCWNWSRSPTVLIGRHC